jgi:hypothetical protein
MSAAVFEYQCFSLGKETPDWFQEWINQMHQLTKDPTISQSFNPSIAPINMFRSLDPPAYRSFDVETGLPLTDLLDALLSKSSLKKLRKAQDLHQKRHQKWLQQQSHSDASTKSPKYTLDDRNTSKDEDAWPTSTELNCPLPVGWKSTLDPSFCMVVSGTFGKRQGLQILSDMGPFCHVVQI